ncbi:hypothetical protein GA0061101_11078 [Rhizobium lusitanum]|uniref:EamA domain-containing protein n=1 Tax=Rhizobium lusitanum TaxID=293958 RepID=A0A1C3WD73_9HYPH|nr:hypothetical protein GA0061101_11078 [Rhizobium lusitanum]
MPANLVNELLLVLSIAWSWNAFIRVFDPKAQTRLLLSFKTSVASSVAVAATGFGFLYYGPISGRVVFGFGIGLSCLWSSKATDPAPVMLSSISMLLFLARV